ncbi:putative holin-like toxin [Oceanobacillus profundus]|uniref:Holin-like toxin n=1 Tax=Oceanobacillus longus TaxID=930120 RepID=A0ABV8GZ47_9BACI|nr:putative holin-like toxin [Oceanobacillus profundus]MCM3399439.1 putative holin-like toxin [Oceanobacillus profundus]MDO6450482.1 putative holin-like toxin [Oceanobacillus profundus]
MTAYEAIIIALTSSIVLVNVLALVVQIVKETRKK